jgi:hypothetical protein
MTILKVIRSFSETLINDYAFLRQMFRRWLLVAQGEAV